MSGAPGGTPELRWQSEKVSPVWRPQGQVGFIRHKSPHEIYSLPGYGSTCMKESMVLSHGHCRHLRPAFCSSILSAGSPVSCLLKPPSRSLLRLCVTNEFVGGYGD